MSNTSPDLSQTLQNLSQNFPGATGGGAGLPPQSIDSRIQALLRAPLAEGDKIARITDIMSELASVTVGGAPNATDRKLSVVGGVRAISAIEIPAMNGIQGSLFLYVAEAVATLQGVLLLPPYAMTVNILMANLPMHFVLSFISVNNPNTGHKTNDQVYVSGAGLYTSNLTPNTHIQIAAVLQRIT